MAKIITDKNRINEILTRGVESIYPNREFLEKVLSSGKRLRIYCGFDPSAPSLHIGNAIQMNKLAQFQALGHEIIFLVGDFTGMIGDPTDKTATRKKLTRKEVLVNAKNYKKQASAYLKFGLNGAKVMYNSKWQDKVSFKDLIELSSHFTVQQMLVRDMFQERLKAEKPIHLHEFLYPLAQAYDSVAMDVDMEIGGNDQTFNMLAGRDLMKAVKGKEKFVLTTKLLVDPTGKKMGKSEGNIVNLDADPNDMYGRIMSWPDGVLPVALELCTDFSMEEIRKMQNELSKPETNPRDHKMKLAFEVTRINHGEKEALRAQDHFIKTVQKKEIPEQITNYKLQITNIKLVDLLVETKLAGSKGEARRLIEQGGIKVNNEVVQDMNKEIEITKEGVLLQRGKRQFIKAVKA